MFERFVSCLRSFGDPEDTIRRLCGAEIADQVNPIDGLDEEGEANGLWRDSGVQGLWYMSVNFIQARFHSNHIAMRMFSPFSISKDG